MNQKILLLKGLPGSGKTEYAKQYCLNNPEFVRINKDDIRILLGNLPYSREVEKEVLRIERDLGLTILKLGKSIIVDDTNFATYHTSYWKNVAESGFEFLSETIDTPVEVCIQRDLSREKSVGKQVILDMYERYVKPYE